ncbi:MAG: glycosyltransferase [Eubacterium sp.]|nr:glycosyltransferase [Eubacterium sp.]
MDIICSVIIPAYNAEKYLTEAVLSALRQKVKTEILIIDDHSSDKTRTLAKKLESEHEEVRLLVLHGNHGVAAARNLGINEAKGKYIAFLDADDWWAEGKLKAQINLLENTGEKFSCTARELVSSDGQNFLKVIGVKKRITYEMLLRTNSISCSSVVIDAALAKRHPMVRDDLHEDYIMWLEIMREGFVCLGINEPYLKSRMSEEGKSRNKKKSALMTFGVYRYMGMGLLKSCYYFVHYAINGFLKYR